MANRLPPDPEVPPACPCAVCMASRGIDALMRWEYDLLTELKDHPDRHRKILMKMNMTPGICGGSDEEEATAANVGDHLRQAREQFGVDCSPAMAVGFTMGMQYGLLCGVKLAMLPIVRYGAPISAEHFREFIEGEREVCDGSSG